MHFSPVHPWVINQALIDAGVKPLRKWFEVEPEKLGFDSGNSIIFLHNKERPALEFEDSEFEVYTPENLAKYTDLPEWTKQYYVDCILQGKNPLLFARVPHLLYHGALHIEDLTLIEV